MDGDDLGNTIFQVIRNSDPQKRISYFIIVSFKLLWVELKP